MVDSRHLTGRYPEANELRILHPKTSGYNAQKRRVRDVEGVKLSTPMGYTLTGYLRADAHPSPGSGPVRRRLLVEIETYQR